MSRRRRGALTELKRLYDIGRKPQSISKALEAEEAVEAGVGVPRAYAESTGLNVSPEYVRQRARELGFNTRGFHGTTLMNIDKDLGGTDSFHFLRPNVRVDVPASQRIGSHSAIDPRVASRFAGSDQDLGASHGFNNISDLNILLDQPFTTAPRVYDVLMRGNERYVRNPFYIDELGKTGDDKVVSAFLRSEYARRPDLDLNEFGRMAPFNIHQPDLSGAPRLGKSDLTPDQYLELARKFYADRNLDDINVIGDLDDRRYFHLSENWSPAPGVLNAIRQSLADQGYGFLKYRNTSPHETAGGKYDTTAFINLLPMRSPRAIFDPLLLDEPNLLYAEGGLV